MKTLYLVLAVLGAAIPYAFFLQHFRSDGIGLDRLLAALFVNAISQGFSADLFLSSAVFWVFIVQQRSRNRGPRVGLFVGLNLLLGLSCALPAYLYARERAREQTRAKSP